MRRSASALLALAFALWPTALVRPYTLQFTGASAATQIRWPTNVINVALSTSLQSPPPNVKAGSDALGAARRALAHWSEVSNVQFNVVTSPNQDMSPAGQPDGVNLITIADTGINRLAFNSPDVPGRARVFFNPNTGAISEADIAVNPTQQFSTDGTFGTFDLESTLVHEIGHMLGLEHSGDVGATMQPRQSRNGTFDLAAQTARSLSEDDIAGVRSIYGPRAGLGSIAGTVRNAAGPVFGAHVFAEESSTGRLKAGNVTLADGSYRIEGLPPGQYRLVVEPLDEPVAAAEIASRSGAYQGLQSAHPSFVTAEAGPVGVAADATTNFSVLLAGNTTAFLNPRFVGVNSQLSSTPAPLVPGTVQQVLVGGDNVHLVGPGGVTVTSGFITVNQSSVQEFVFNGPDGPVQVLSFNVTVASTTPPGDYSIRLVAPNQTAYVAGGLTVDPPNGTTLFSANPIDNTQFFVAQHYRDFLNREPDSDGFAFWTNQINECTTQACREIRRINVSAAFFLSPEFQETGYLVYRFYDAAFDRFPRFREFLPDTQRIGRGVVLGRAGADALLEANKRAYAEEFVARPQFLSAYPTTLSPEEFVDRLNANTGFSLSQVERDALVAGLRAGTETRATVLRRVAEDPDERQREFNRAFVLMQYFGYLRRNPDDSPDTSFAGYQFWLDKLNQFGGNYVAAEMIKAFITSTEYRRRFGPA